ncbi:MAG TPA: hypothetical protein VFP65_29820 [Anaeromyxobacteraceae bacterium]|nr:hypothetical protein [Anaeromyxobacteraceae bacterium]
MTGTSNLLRVAAGLLALLLLLAAPPGGASPLTDPLGTGTPGPIRQLFLDPVLADARAVDRPSLAARLELANSWSVPTLLQRGGQVAVVQLDAEAEAVAVSGRLPWSRLLGSADGWPGRIASTLTWRATYFWGGFTDGGIEAWHHLIGSYNFQRQLYPRDHLHLTLAEPSGARAIALDAATFAAGDAVLGTQALLASGGESSLDEGRPAWGLATRLDVKLPLGSLSRAGGSGGFDAALSLLASGEVTSWLVLHGRASAGVVSPLASSIALQPRRFQGSLEASVVGVWKGWGLVVEDRLVSPLMESGWISVDGGDDGLFVSSASNAMLRWHNQISVGVRRGGVTLSFGEDFTPGYNPRGEFSWFYNSNAPDVLLTLSWSREL